MRNIKEFFLDEEKGLMGLLISVLLLLFVVYPLSDAGIINNTVYNIFIIILMILSLVSINVFKEKRWVYILLGVVIFIFNIVTLISESFILNQIHQILKFIFFNLIMFVVIRKITHSNTATKYTVVGSVVVYLLFGISCGIIYNFCNSVIQNSFIVSDPVKTRLDLTYDFMYYSFSTLTTIGFDNITPISPITRSISIFETLVGQLYPVVMIGSIISLRVNRLYSERENK